MALTENKSLDLIQVLETGVLQVRYATVVIRDGSVLAKAYERELFTPGQDLTGQPEKVVAIANVAWTPEVIAAYEAQQAANALRGE